MATSNYSWNLPTVGGSEDTWGTSLNANWTALDTLLGGVNSTEFAILDGATVSTTELNKLDGVTASTTEINTLDGVTSSIQTQLNGKAATSTLISAGSGLTGGGDLSANRTISHADTSSQGSVNNSGSVYIQDITLDTYGHVTGITSTTIPTSAPTTAQVLTATAGATAGAVGTYVFAKSNTDTTVRSAGATVTGSQYLYGGGYNDSSTPLLRGTGSGTLSGTWRVMGYFNSATNDTRRGHSLMLRIS